MKKRAPVSQIMTKNPISVNLSNELTDVVQIFKDYNIHHIPVVTGDRLIGMISKTDLERITYVNDYSSSSAGTAVYTALAIEQVMTKQVETVQVEDQIRTAATLLAKGSYHALPVLKDEQLVGIVTSTDVINYLLEQY